jgi:hypothetical protein
MLRLAPALLLLSLSPADEMERIALAPTGQGFVFAQSGKPFNVIGFNYDHDEKGRLIEDYWDAEWPKIEGDFAEMAALGATVVRVHLQFGRFMEAADRPNEKALAKLRDLLVVAEKHRLYLDVTGLGCYHKADVPPWYDTLDEEGRWAAQERFWEAVAAACAPSPAVFCHDLMNEPVVPGGRRKEGDWLGPGFAGKHFVQFITLDSRDRPRPEIAAAWAKRLAAAVRRHDPGRLVTIGLVDWSLDRPGLSSGFIPEKVAPELDFLCVHLYPEAGKVDEAIEVLKAFHSVGKPVVIEETFTLKCGIEDFKRFADAAKPFSAGLIGFYWGQPPGELRPAKTIGEALMLQWLEFFEERAREIPTVR